MITLNKSKILLSLLTALIIVSSCVPRSRLAYVQSEKDVDIEDTFFEGQQIDNIIRPGDEIYIRITSADEERTSFVAQGQPGGVYDPTFLSYTISDDGTVKLPYIGRIVLANLTLEEATDSIEADLAQYLFIPSVYMRFINTKVTVLGEVNSPGVYMFNYKNINIMQAIGYANDITEFGNRSNVLIIREDGTRKRKHHVNLLSDDLLESEWYLIKSNDIIYVEPLGRKRFDMRTVPYNLIFSAITTAVMLLTFIK